MIQSLPGLRRQFVAEEQAFHEFPAEDPRHVRALSLEQLKKQAKELRAQWREGRSLEGLALHHPEGSRLTPERVQLADAQHVIARQAGFHSWAKLKHHIEATQMANAALASGQSPAPDAGRKTLHIRCGHDVMFKLAVAGFEGDFLAFADPYVHGPVPGGLDLPHFIQLRAAFIAGEHWRSPEQALSELTADYQALEYARNYQSVAFWFEHDAYDALIFLKLLSFFSDPSKRAADMRYICLSQYPGVQRFNGLGQLPAQAMRVLWPRFEPLTGVQFAAGHEGWSAYTERSPEALCRWASQGKPDLPQIIPAIQRQLRELPWLGDGLALSERLTLQCLAQHGDMDAATLFYHWYSGVYEPLPFLGDSAYWRLLDALAGAPEPAILVRGPHGKPKDQRVSLTAFGHRLLTGGACWTEANPYDRWFGGTHNRSDAGIWYWDETTRRVLQRG